MQAKNRKKLSIKIVCCYLLSIVDIFCEIFHRSVGSPVLPIRFSGPRRTGGKSSRHVGRMLLYFVHEDFQAPT